MIVATYDYPEPDGVVRLHKLRLEPKRFVMEARKRPGCTWVRPSTLENRYPGARELFSSLLYNLPLLLAEPPSVALAEGEKDARALTAAGVPTLSHWQGAQNFTESQAERFRGYTGQVYLVADADAAGAACVVRRYDLLRSVGVSASRLRLLVPARGYKDAADHLAADHGLHEFRRWNLDGMRGIAASAPPPRSAGKGYDPGRAIGGHR